MKLVLLMVAFALATIGCDYAKPTDIDKLEARIDSLSADNALTDDRIDSLSSNTDKGIAALATKIDSLSRNTSQQIARLDTLVSALSAVDDNVLQLDGINDRAEASTTIYPATSTATDFTVEVWIYPTDAGTFIISDDFYDLILYSNSGGGVSNNGIGIKFNIWDDSCSGSLSTIEYRDVRLNRWNHIAVMFDASAWQFTIAINGILSSSPTDVPPGPICSATDQNFAVGGIFGREDVETFSGMVDEIRISDIVRYDTDFIPADVFVADDHTKGLWHFDEAIGSTSFADASGDGNTLRGVNGVRTAAP